MGGHAGGSGEHIILKCDSEKTMIAFRDAIANFHEGVVIPKCIAKNESRSNGAVRGTGRIVRTFATVFKIQIEYMPGIEIASTHSFFYSG